MEDEATILADIAYRMHHGSPKEQRYAQADLLYITARDKKFSGDYEGAREDRRAADLIYKY